MNAGESFPQIRVQNPSSCTSLGVFLASHAASVLRDHKGQLSHDRWPTASSKIGQIGLRERLIPTSGGRFQIVLRLSHASPPAFRLPSARLLRRAP